MQNLALKYKLQSFKRKQEFLPLESFQHCAEGNFYSQVTVVVPDAGKLDLQKNPKLMLNDILQKYKLSLSK